MREITISILVAVALVSVPFGDGSKEMAAIFVSDYETKTLIEGASIYAVSTARGVLELGETNVFGRMDISVRLIQDQDTLVLLACDEWYQCGAILLDQNARKKREFHLSLTILSM